MIVLVQIVVAFSIVACRHVFGTLTPHGRSTFGIEPFRFADCCLLLRAPCYHGHGGNNGNVFRGLCSDRFVQSSVVLLTAVVCLGHRAFMAAVGTNIDVALWTIKLLHSLCSVMRGFYILFASMVLGGRVAEFWLIVPLFVTGPVHREYRLLKKRHRGFEGEDPPFSGGRCLGHVLHCQESVGEGGEDRSP